MTEPTLFIGGPKDGQILNVNRKLPMVFETGSPLTLKTPAYDAFQESYTARCNGVEAGLCTTPSTLLRA